MASAKVVNLFYDVTSPYSWLAFEVLCRYRRVWPMDLKFRPAFLGGIMNSSGNQPPGLLPARGRYMAKDIRRLSSFMDVPLNLTPFTWDYVINTGTLPAQRFLTAVSLKCDTHLESLSRKLWFRLWSLGEEIHDPETFKAFAAECGINKEMAEELCQSISSPDVKTKLKDTTQEVLDLGAFGLPCFTTLLPGRDKPELFFGSDRIELLAHVMGVPYIGPLPDKDH